MAQIRPQSLAEFSQLSGVGSHKLAQYGKKFLDEITAHTQQQTLTPHGSDLKNQPTQTEFITLRLHQEGLSVAEIAKKRHLSPSTITNHLAELLSKDQPVDLNQLVPIEHQQKIWQVLEVLGDIPLTPVKEQLGRNYTFEEIRLVREKWRRANREQNQK